MKSRVVVNLAGVENYGWEGGLINGVREALSFDTKREISINFTAACDRDLLQIVSAVELASKLGGFDGHDATSLGLPDGNSMRHFFLIIRLIKRHAVVVAARGLLDLIESLADSVEFQEIKRRAFDWLQSTGRDRRLVNRQVMIGIEFELVVVNCTGCRSAQVPESMLRPQLARFPIRKYSNCLR